MSIPAGRPCRVMTMSSVAANRGYFERSPLALTSATTLIGRSFPLEPGLRLGLPNDRKDFDGRFRNVIEYPYVIDSEPILWSAQATQPLDTAPADLLRFMSQVALEGIPDPTADARW